MECCQKLFTISILSILYRKEFQGKFMIFYKMLPISISRFKIFPTNPANIWWMVDMLGLDMLNDMALILAGVLAHKTGPLTLELPQLS